MSEYIITDEQLKTAAEAYSEHELSLPITEVLISGDKLPEIVRCRDCIWFHRKGEPYGDDDVYLIDWCECVNDDAEPDGFCSVGTRREP